jgi:hypothetical protein
MVPLLRIALAGALSTAVLAAVPALAESGLKVPERGEPGLDPAFAKGWFAPEYDRFGFAAYQWRDAYGFAPSPRMQWSYALSQRANLSMSVANNGRDSDLDHRPLSVFGRYWFAPDWAVSAESASRDATGLFRLQDLRIGVQRRF